MKSAIPTDDQIGTFVDAGSTGLRHYAFISDELNKKRARPMGAVRVAAPDSEMPVQFRLNQTGNIFYSTTSDQMATETKNLFDSVTVLFAAMTKALAGKGKDLFDYGAWSSIISKSGYFVEVQKFERNLTIESSSLTIDTQIVQQLIPGLTSGNSLEIAKSVLSALNGKYQTAKEGDTTKFGHLLFICEELFGAPSVTVRLFFASKASHQKITSSPCHKTTTQSFEQLQEANTFLFVSPDTIAKFASQFGASPEAYNKLIEKLSSYI